MSSVTVNIPDIVMKQHQHNLPEIEKRIQEGLIVMEYLNGNLGIEECGNALNLGYRGFIEWLWNKGLNLDELSEQQLETQVDQLEKKMDAS